MYGRGNFPPPRGQGPETSVSTSQQLVPPHGNFPPPRGQGPETSVSTSQQLVPPHLPPPPYQLGDRPQQPQMMEKGPPFYPAPHQAYPRPYGNDHHVSAPTAGISSSGQSYLVPLSLPPPPSQTQGHSARMAHPFPSLQQNSQWTQNLQHVIPPLPPTFGRPPSNRSGPETLLPHPPPRLQPPMLSQGQALYRGFLPSPVPGPVQGLQHTPLTQPPPPNHTPYVHGQFGSIKHPVSQNPHKSSTGLLPPPLPPSPPPGPPPPPAVSPPPTSPSSLSKRPPISPSFQSKSAGAQQHDVAQEDVQTSDAPARSVQVESSMDEDLSHSPANSNMDIEDEMIEIDENKRCSGIVDGESVLVSSECEVEKELHEPHILANNTSLEESASRNTFFSDKSESVDHREDVKRPNAAGSVDNENVSTELVKGTSAFKLLQDYASDDNTDSDHEPCIKDIASAPVYPSGESVAACLESETGSDFMKNGTKNSSESERGYGLSSERGVSLEVSVPSKSLDSSLVLQGPSKEVDTTIIMKDNRPDHNRHANQHDIKSGTSDKDFEQKSNRESHVRPASDVGKTRKEDGKHDSASQLKVDEFGRLVRESDSGSDSDDLRRSRRHGRRGRIRSRSRSPHDRRRSPQGRIRSRSRSPHDRRRSPRRRRQKRSRSRSWSPKKPRSRSRSPSRHGVQYGSDRTRRDKVPSQACFDYQRGKCYRGASCRYSHSDSVKSDLSRGYRSKYQTVQLSPKKTGKSVHKNDEDKSQEMQLCRDLSGNSLGASKDCSVDRKEIASARNISDKDVELLISSVAESVRTREEAAQVQGTEHTRDERVESSIHESANNICMEVGVSLNDARKLPPGSTCHETETSAGQKLQANLVNQVLQKADHHPQPLDAPSTHDPETLPASQSNLNPHSVPELSYQSRPTGSVSKSFSSETFSTQHLRFEEPSPQNSHQPSQFLPPPPPTSQPANAPPQMPRDYIMMLQNSRYQSLPTPPDNFTPYQASLSNQHASYSISGNSAWNSLPQPPHRHYDNESTVHVSSSYGLPSSQFQEMHTYSQGGESHRQFYPPTQQPNQPLSHVEDNKSTALPTVSTTTQQFGGPSTVGDGGLTSLPGRGGQILSAEGSVHHQPIPSSAGRIQSFGSNNQQSGEPLSSSSQRYSNLQQPLDALQHPTDENVSVTGKPGTTKADISSYNSDYFQRNLPSHVPDFVGSRIPTHYNPYAGDPYSSSHVSADVRVVDSVDSKNVTCLTNSNQAVEKTLLNSTGDQYDPLFDSIEPASNSFRTPNNDQKNEITDDSNMDMKLSGSNKLLDFAENTKQKEAVAVMSSLDNNDEYGETAEAEVGAVENGSSSDPIDEANIAAGETEIDQVNTSGRSKKGKDSRSMKLFKGALADFVKEVLKPSWRQGNMSKEAFKTIVKKTVDKVSGAMKSHQVPKSQTKIDHYIDSSQRKLTKLVMGYVDKYVKV